MSEHRGGAWGSREDGFWWPSSGPLSTEQTHQQLFNHHHQQQLVAAHQQHASSIAAQQVQHDAAIRSTAAATAAQQLFSYKMASSFQNPATTVSSASVSSPLSYDYHRMTANQNMVAASQQAAQWWYPSAMESNIQNVQNIPSPQSLMNRRMPRVAKSDAKPRGRMTAYAFFVQICSEEHKKKHPEENVVFTEFSKKCAERWKTMSDKEKRRFHEMADKDKKRYDTEMQSYVPPKGEKVRGKKRKQMKDPNAPKRSLSAFFLYCKDERPKVKAANPEYGVGDIAKELGKRWAEVDSSLKSKYEAMAEKDKARYDKEMTEYKKKSKIGVPPPIEAKGESDEEEEEEEEEDDDDE